MVASYSIIGENGLEIYDWVVEKADYGSPKTVPNPTTLSEPKSFYKDFCYLMKFQLTSEFITTYNEVRELVTREDALWTPLEDIHITLVYVNGIDTLMHPDLIEHLTIALQDFKAVPITITGFDTFNTDKGDMSNVLYFEPVKTTELVVLQAKLYNMVNSYIVMPLTSMNGKVSDYSNPANWNPHMTLAYFDKPFYENLMLRKPLQLQPSRIEATSEYAFLGSTSS